MAWGLALGSWGRRIYGWGFSLGVLGFRVILGRRVSDQVSLATVLMRMVQSILRRTCGRAVLELLFVLTSSVRRFAHRRLGELQGRLPKLAWGLALKHVDRGLFLKPASLPLSEFTPRCR